jgi:arabinosaccharide transport system substrate-binding protein
MMLLRQADGNLFDEQDRPTLNLSRNAAILARLVTWFTGPARVCADVDLFSASGHKQRLDGVVIGSILPDWMAGQWKNEMPGLAGKVKVMPLPAWEAGGRRTSVWRGGTMLGISKRAPRPDDAWAFITHLALSPELAEDLFRKTTIVPPNRSLWSLPVFDEPDPYFSGQPVGRLYLDQAGDVPTRSSSPYASSAQDYLNNALVVLRAYADRNKLYDPAALQPEAQRLLDAAQQHLVREIGRNTFLAPTP